MLTPEQITAVRELMRIWRETGEREQRRRIALTAMAASAVRRRLALAVPGPEAHLFPAKTERPLSVSNYERLLRSFVYDNRDVLVELDIDVDE